jgi:hypothetical protein
MNRPSESAGVQLTERSDIQPFQGWGVGVTSTQGGASLTLGFGIEPRWGSRTEPRRMRSHGRTAAQQCHAGDADAVSTVCSAGSDVTFVERSEVVKEAPLMAVRYRNLSSMKRKLTEKGGRGAGRLRPGRRAFVPDTRRRTGTIRMDQSAS